MRALLLLPPVGGGERWRSLWCCWITSGAFALPVVRSLAGARCTPGASRSRYTPRRAAVSFPRALYGVTPLVSVHTPPARVLSCGRFLLSHATPRAAFGAASLWRSLLRALFFPTRLTLPAFSGACFLCGRFCSWVVGTGLLPACASPWFPAGLSCVSPRWIDIGALPVTGRSVSYTHLTLPTKRIV